MSAVGCWLDAQGNPVAICEPHGVPMPCWLCERDERAISTLLWAMGLTVAAVLAGVVTGYLIVQLLRGNVQASESCPLGSLHSEGSFLPRFVEPVPAECGNTSAGSTGSTGSFQSREEEASL